MDAAIRLFARASLVLCLFTAYAVARAEVPDHEAALRALKSTDAAERQRAVVRLAKVGSMDDVPALLAALRDTDDDVRAIAEAAIWTIWSRSGDPKVDKLFAQGLGEMRVGHYSEAIALFSQVIEMKPEFAEGWNKRATLYFLVEEYEKSLHDCDEVIKRNPQHFGALSGYGQIYLRLHEPEKALEYFKRALAVNPNLDGLEVEIHILEQLLERQQKNRA